MADFTTQLQQAAAAAGASLAGQLQNALTSQAGLSATAQPVGVAPTPTTANAPYAVSSPSADQVSKPVPTWAWVVGAAVLLLVLFLILRR